MKPLPDRARSFRQTALFRPLSFLSFTSCCGYRSLIIMMLLLPLTGPLSAQPARQWDKTLGGADLESLTALQQTRDGGYILGGWSVSGISGDKTQLSRGAADYWVLKLDAAGNKVWDKTLGGNSWDHLTALQQTKDGGYILGGYSASDISGDKSEAKRGGVEDFWVLKLDAAGNKQWDKTIGGTEGDYLNTLQQTQDGGYILGGTSYSGIGGDKTGSKKGECDLSPLGCLPDYWVVKLDATGIKQWDKTFGGTGLDALSALQQTRDGGYILGGNSDSDLSGDKTQDHRGRWDYWIVRLDAAGNKVWDKTLGGNDNEFLRSLQQTREGGYVVGGASFSGIGGEKSEANRGGADDYWVVKLDAAGNKQWDKTLGGNQGDVLYALQQTRDGGYILGGGANSGSSGNKTEASQGGTDYWMVKLDAAGNQVWDKTIGSNGGDNLTALQQTQDGGFVLGGTSGSGIGGDKTQASRGFDDFWVVKLGPFREAQQVLTFTLINTEAEQPIRMLNDGDTIDLADLPTKKLSIRADTDPAQVGSVKFELSGRQTRTHVENQVPYALFGDIRGDYEKWFPALGPAPGSYTLTATPYTGPNGQGEAGTPLTIRFTVKPPRVLGFTLINTQSELPIRTLQDGDEINLSDLPTQKLNIRADTDPAQVGSVKFALSGRQTRTHVENQMPYALFGDIRGDYEKWYPAPGNYTLTAIPYVEANARSTAGTPLTIHFTVVSKPAAGAAARMAQAPAPPPRLMLYPNPTTDGRLRLQLPVEVQGLVRYSLLSSVGAKLAEGSLDLAKAGNLLALDFSGQLQTAGVYYLSLEGANGRQVFKIMRK